MRGGRVESALGWDWTPLRVMNVYDEPMFVMYLHGSPTRQCPVSPITPYCIMYSVYYAVYFAKENTYYDLFFVHLATRSRPKPCLRRLPLISLKKLISTVEK